MANSIKGGNEPTWKIPSVHLDPRLIEEIFIFQIIHSIIYLYCKFDDNDVEMLFEERNTLSETECLLVIPFSNYKYIFVDLFAFEEQQNLRSTSSR